MNKGKEKFTIQIYPRHSHGLMNVGRKGQRRVLLRVIMFAPHDGAKFMSPRFNRGNCRGVPMCVKSQALVYVFPVSHILNSDYSILETNLINYSVIPGSNSK